ncbi:MULTISPECIES: YetF domain-containing protein [unclassified Nocardia]|uniref:DUF421 domain-containing protein n=1 Tax=unclassified Nocardia TaxID=2637762 RepID=UPI0024A878FF|nr:MULTISPECIES: YetF domain-containing protein [unclassified Nocardia]
MWFDAWPDLLRVLLVGSAAYVTLVVVLRATGKRTLAKLNAFDLVVTVALGSTLATILLSAEVSWAEGAVALLLLALLQYAAALVATRPRGGRRLLTAAPTLVVRDGRLLERAMRQQRLSAADIRQAVRSDGHGDLTRIAAVILETDGSLSVITGAAFGDGSALDGVAEPE